VKYHRQIYNLNSFTTAHVFTANTKRVYRAKVAVETSTLFLGEDRINTLCYEDWLVSNKLVYCMCGEILS